MNGERGSSEGPEVFRLDEYGRRHMNCPQTKNKTLHRVEGDTGPLDLGRSVPEGEIYFTFPPLFPFITGLFFHREGLVGDVYKCKQLLKQERMIGYSDLDGKSKIVRSCESELFVLYLRRDDYLPSRPGREVEET